MATAFVSLKIRIAYFNSRTPKTLEKFLDFLHRTDISAILTNFCLNLVVMATSYTPLKVLILYLNSPTPNILQFAQEIFLIFNTELKFVQFWLISPKFGCHSNSLGSLKN